ncbi:MAG: hypothetical protein JST04_00960 [Bdellovibrionales bacterium]|nr:hypothetical protein [Bdellovibrionales bacterium]
MKDIIIKHNKGEISLKTLEEDNNLDLEQVPENNDAQIIKSLIDKIKELSEKPKEYILCAAIHWDNINALNEDLRASNKDNGLTSIGYRHVNCMELLNKLTEGYYYNIANLTYGFLTNTNRFVDRKEAYIIAKAANQIIEPIDHDMGILTSENLY